MQLPLLTPLGNHGVANDQRTQAYTEAMNRKAKSLSGRQTSTKEDEEGARAVSREFAAFFIGEMFKSMDEAEPISDFGYGGTPEKIFQEMVYEEYAREIAAGEGFGLAELAYQGVLQQQGIQSRGL
ncbi:MAG: rod-binding protein [Planctomycetes bacterium]|nr:rod-binding protein [Planctomycetota bacterium]